MLLALVLILGVIAPVFGILMQRVLVRDLGSAPIGVSLVVTVGLLVALIGVATQIWPPAPRIALSARSRARATIWTS